MSNNFSIQVKTATKWSAITEIVSKLVTPISNMVLARLLTPDAFGVVTTLTMIISFAELFTDAGFQKYLVQHNFKNNKDRELSTTVAFWSNLSLSFIFWGIIIISSEKLATLVGNPGLGRVLSIACFSIPIGALSSIQIALFKRDLDFRTLFKVRLISVFIPLFITVPLAFWLRSYWALVIGTLSVNVINAIFLTAFSKWKPRLYFSFKTLKEMFSFTIWSMIEAISIWLTSYIDIFIVGTVLSQYYLGLYKTSSTLVGQIMGLITATATPVLFSALSRLQNSEEEFRIMFFRFQKLVSMLIMPIGVGIYLFRDMVTTIILGNLWIEASGFVGLWGITSAVTIVMGHFSSEVYRAKGLPRLSVLAQWLHIIVLLPAVIISVRYGFETLYTTRSLIRMELVLVHAVIMWKFVGVSFMDMCKNIYPSLLSALVMAAVGYVLIQCLPNTLTWQLMKVAICILVYGSTIALFSQERGLFKRFLEKELV